MSESSREQAEERRAFNTNRRSKERQGKYDRRRNRCGRCRYLKSDNYCEKWEKSMTPHDFACIHYDFDSLD